MSADAQTKLFDVLAVNLNTLTVRVIADNKTERNAEAIITMAVMRRGVEEEFFVETSAGTYTPGEAWSGRR